VKARLAATIVAATVAAFAAACSESGPPNPPSTAPPSAAGGSGAASVAGTIPGGVTPGAPAGNWTDPEPAGAQAIAESNAGASWNANRTTRLQMSMTSLVGQTTGLVGAQTAVAGATTTVDERLSRLGAQTTQTEITIRLPGSVLFDFDSASIRPDAERTLAEVSEVLKAYAKRPMRVEGHTDSVAPDEYNRQLSERRAESVRTWLASRGGVASALATRGWGESKPAATNDTPAGRQQNRRVEVIIEKGS